MNIQARKLLLIEEFLRINDEDLIRKIENFLIQEKKIYRERILKPMLLEEFNEMIDQAVKESEAGKVISHPDLKKKVKSWGK